MRGALSPLKAALAIQSSLPDLDRWAHARLGLPSGNPAPHQNNRVTLSNQHACVHVVSQGRPLGLSTIHCTGQQDPPTPGSAISLLLKRASRQPASSAKAPPQLLNFHAGPHDLAIIAVRRASSKCYPPRGTRTKKFQLKRNTRAHSDLIVHTKRQLFPILSSAALVVSQLP